MTSCTSFYIVSIVTAVIKGEFKLFLIFQVNEHLKFSVS